MKRLPLLERSLSRLFTVPRRRADPFRRQRATSKSLAAEHGIEIEMLRGGGVNVWPPASITDAVDPYHGDHYCNDWGEVLVAVEAYAAIAIANVREVA